MSELLITLSNVSLNEGSSCLRSFVGIGSSRHVDDLDERIKEFSSGRSMGAKDSRRAPGLGGVNASHVSTSQCPTWKNTHTLNIILDDYKEITSYIYIFL